MATFKKAGSRWRVQICVNRIRRSATFESKSAAQVWASEQELEIRGGVRGEIPDKTFSDLLDRYVKSVSPHKKGYRWESVRIEALKRDRIAQVRLKDLSARDISDWRDRRLQAVSGASVLREKNLLSNVCSVGVNEWHWLKFNPFHKVRMPQDSKPRDRVMSDDERIKLGEVANTEIYKEVLRIADFAVETAMRAGEICGLKEIKGNVAVLTDTKNGTSRRVPLSQRAIELFGEGFNLTPRQLDVHWRNLNKLAGIKDLHFHDTRHTAITKLSKKLNVLELARMVGHKDIRMLQVYYNEPAEEIAKKL